MLYNFYNIISNVVNELENESINRGLEVNIDKENAEKYFNNNPKVQFYYPLVSNEPIKGDKFIININYFNYRTVKLLYGRKINENNEIIISKNYLNYLKLDEQSYAKQIKLKLNNKDYSFNIVGVTNNNYAHIYMNYDLFNEIFDLALDKYYVMTTNHTNFEQLSKELSENNFYNNLSDSTGEIEIDSLKEIRNIFFYLGIGLCILIFIFIYMIIKNIVNDEIKDIAIFKAIGFKYKKILQILLFRFLFLLSIIYLIFLIFILILTIINYFIIKVSYISFSNLFNFTNITTLIILFIVLFNLLFTNIKINKINILQVLDDY